MVPDVPEEVEMKIKRQHYMAKEALAENQVSSLLLVHFAKCQRDVNMLVRYQVIIIIISSSCLSIKGQTKTLICASSLWQKP